MSYIQNKLDAFKKEFPSITDENITATQNNEKDIKSAELLTKFMRIEAKRLNDYFKQSLTDYHNHIVENIEEPVLVESVHNLDSYISGYKACLNKVKSVQDTNPKE